MEKKYLELESKIVELLRTVYDPEIPVNIYDLGLIYRIELKGSIVEIDMTLTSPNCPMVEDLPETVRRRIKTLDEVDEVKVNLVFDPVWTKEMMSDEARLELGDL